MSHHHFFPASPIIAEQESDQESDKATCDAFHPDCRTLMSDHQQPHAILHRSIDGYPHEILAHAHAHPHAGRHSNWKRVAAMRPNKNPMQFLHKL